MTSTQKSSPKANTAKWIFSILLLCGAGYANSYYGDFPTLYRFIALLAVGFVALFVLSKTKQGSAFIQLAKEARQEMKKVVWPKRNETMVTSGFVVVVVVLFSLILWAVDSFLRYIISTILG
ncbi:MAG: preprotein translocase subunit SecE [Pseudomonadota bacterium]|nr:preprotein translocase subunit SecE [Pseudomonadota bacterium]